MKKLFFAIMAVAAITFASCGKTATPGNADQQAEAPAEAAQVAEALQNDLNSGDANTFKARVASIIEKVQSLVKENPVQAKEYLAKAQEFLKANADKVTSLIGGNAEIASLVSSITDVDASSFVDKLAGVEQAKEQIEGVQDAVEGKVEELKEGAEGIKDAVEGKVDELKENAEGVKDAVENVVGGLGL